jgi:hypothetical protein
MPLKEPPQPPELLRRFRMHRHQMIGLPLLALLPILALFGVFDGSTEFASATAGALRTSVEYPSKIKYKDYNQLRIKVTNSGQQTLDTVSVSIDTTYLSRFLNVSITPNPADAYKIELIDVVAGEKREVIVEYEGKDYGQQSGDVTISSKADTIRHPISTYIYW